MSDIYNKTTLDSFGIYELRNIARKVGVACPTMLKKEDLINKIIGIITGVDKPKEKINKQGRPAKEISSLKEVLDIFVPIRKDKTEEFHNSIILSGNLDVLMQSEQEILPNEEGASEIEGLLYVYPEGYGSIYNNDIGEKVYLTAPQISVLGLKIGDKIKGYYKPHGKDNLLVLIKVLYINDLACACCDKQRDNFSDMNAKFAFKKLNLSNGKFDVPDLQLIDMLAPVGRGNKCLIEYEDSFDIIEILKKIIDNLTLNIGLSTLLLAPDELYENVDYINNHSSNLKVLSKNFTINNFDNQNDFKLCYEHCLRLAEQGGDVVIIIENIEKLINQFTNYYLLKNECTLMQAKAYALNKIKQLILNSKQSQESGSVTIFVFAEKSMECLNYLQDIFNNKLFFVNRETFENCNFDFENSTSSKLQLLLTKSDYKNWISLKEENNDNKRKEIILNMLK